MNLKSYFIKGLIKHIKITTIHIPLKPPNWSIYIYDMKYIIFVKQGLSVVIFSRHITKKFYQRKYRLYLISFITTCFDGKIYIDFFYVINFNSKAETDWDQKPWNWARDRAISQCFIVNICKRREEYIFVFLCSYIKLY